MNTDQQQLDVVKKYLNLFFNWRNYSGARQAHITKHAGYVVVWLEDEDGQEILS